MRDHIGKIVMIGILIIATLGMLFYIMQSFVHALHGKQDAASGLAWNAVTAVRYLA